MLDSQEAESAPEPATASALLTPELAEAALSLLRRVTLTYDEIDTVVRVRVALEAVARGFVR